MRKSLAVAISCIVLLVWWFCQNLHVKAQGGAGADCASVAYSADANGDGTVDISDPVWILQWLFQGGPPPCAHAKSCDVCLTPEQAQLLDDIAFGRNIAGTFSKRFPDTGITTFSADGGFVQDNEEQFGGFGEGIPDHFASPWRGTWTRVGPIEDRRIKLRATRMNFAEDGSPVCFCELYAEVTFTPDFNSVTGTWTASACLWDTWGPANCDVVNPAEGGVIGYRIPVE